MHYYVINYALFNIFFLCMRAEVQIYAQLIDVKQFTQNLILCSIQWRKPVNGEITFILV